MKTAFGFLVIATGIFLSPAAHAEMPINIGVSVQPMQVPVMQGPMVPGPMMPAPVFVGGNHGIAVPIMPPVIYRPPCGVPTVAPMIGGFNPYGCVPQWRRRRPFTFQFRLGRLAFGFATGY